MESIEYFPYVPIRSPGRFFWNDFDELNCPICLEKYLVRWLINSNLDIGEKMVDTDVHTGDIRVVSLENFFGEMMVPTSRVTKKKIFMNREVFVPSLVEFGAFDQYMNFKFREAYLKIWW